MKAKIITGLVFILAGTLTITPIIMLFVFPKYLSKSEIGFESFRMIIILGLGLTTGVSVSLISRQTTESTALFSLGGFITGLLIVLFYENLSIGLVTLIVGSLIVGLPINAFIFWIKGFESLFPKFNIFF